MARHGLFLIMVAIPWMIIGFVPVPSRAQEDPHIKDLEDRIESLEKIVQQPEVSDEESVPERKPRLYETLEEKKFLEGIELLPGVMLSGLLEVEAEYEDINKKEEETVKAWPN